MRAERWREIEELYHAVREREPGERDRFLQEACIDETLRSEVESLLACESQAESFLEAPALEVTARAFAEGRAQSMLGRVLGHYEIVAFLGAGGMGEVYRARDLRLDREVALKFLSAGFARHPLFLERFRLEARAASALNHPHICTVYDIGEADGQRFIVMELLRGSTLASRIHRQPLPLADLLEFAIEIAGALAAAHDHGIVHRDIKAGNIFLVDRPGELSLAKILDFGLAKLAGELPGAGAAFGTLAYMSPEQTQGLEVDARSDLFSFGVVLYEMATGVFPFADAAHARTRDAILHQTHPPPSQLNPEVPAGLDRIIAKALEKNPDVRYQTAGDLRTDLKRLRLETDVRSLPARRANWKIPSRRWIYGLVAAIILLASAGIILLASAGSWVGHFRATEGSPSNDWLRLTDFSDSATQPALSPDGRWLTFIRGELTFATQGQVYVKRLPDGEPVPLTHDSLAKLSPVFSPDGLRIAYGSRDPWDTWIVPTSGGEPRLLLANASGLRWIDRDRILFSEFKFGAHMALVTARDSGAGKRDVYVPPHERGMAHRSALSPDGKWVLIAEMDNSGWLPCRVAPYDGRDMGRPIGNKGGSCTDVAWSPDGRWMYFSSDATGEFHIWRQQFAGGEPKQFTFGTGTEEGIAMAPDGRSLVTSVGEEQREIWYHQGKQERRISSEGFASNPQVSADGRRIYYVLRHGGNPQRMGFMSGELWRTDLATGRNEPLLPGKIVTGFDVSADGQRITYSTGQPGGKSEIWLAYMNGAKLPRRVPNSSGMFPRFGAGGELYYMAVEGKVNFLYRIKEDGSGGLKVSEDSILALMRVSPDGKWAYVWGLSQDGRGSTGFLLYPTGGGSPVNLCRHCSVAWSPDARRLYVSPGSIIEETGASFIIPFDQGPSPSLVAAGGDSAEKLGLLPGARVIEHSIVAPGPDPATYAFVKVMIHRNLYRVPIP